MVKQLQQTSSPTNRLLTFQPIDWLLKQIDPPTDPLQTSTPTSPSRSSTCPVELAKAFMSLGAIANFQTFGTSKPAGSMFKALHYSVQFGFGDRPLAPHPPWSQNDRLHISFILNWSTLLHPNWCRSLNPWNLENITLDDPFAWVLLMQFYHGSKGKRPSQDKIGPPVARVFSYSLVPLFDEKQAFDGPLIWKRRRHHRKTR